MKKIIKMLGLLLLAAMVFTSCNQQSKEDKDDEKKNIIKPLFDVEDLTVPAAKIEMADGDWVVREVNKQGTQADQLKFTMKDSAIDESEDAKLTYIVNKSATLPDDTPEEEFERGKKLGLELDGNDYYFYKEYNKEEIATLMAKINADKTLLNKKPDDQDTMVAKVLYKAMTNIKHINGYAIKDGKTNEDKTKYYFEDKETKFYLSKK